MRKIFEAELQGVGQDLVAMADAVHTAIEQAGNALMTGDHQLAQQVIAQDAAIDQMQRDLDERCVHILAQQAPVATDLRTLVSALRMSATLERMGDLASHVAEIARGRYPDSAVHSDFKAIFEKMIAAAVDATKQVTVLLRTRDLDLASAISRDDDILDDLRVETYSELLHPSWKGTTQEAVDVTLLVRYLERIGDHCTSISRRIVFLVTGQVRDKDSFALS
jgi:phosphate transport system protein